MLHGLRWQFEFPISRALYALGPVFLVFLPVVEVTYEVDVCSVGSPFSEDPSPRSLVQSEIIVSGCEVPESYLPVACELVDFPQGMVVPSLDGIFEWFEISIVRNQSYVFGGALPGGFDGRLRSFLLYLVGLVGLVLSHKNSCLMYDVLLNVFGSSSFDFEDGLFYFGFFFVIKYC